MHHLPIHTRRHGETYHLTQPTESIRIPAHRMSHSPFTRIVMPSTPSFTRYHRYQVAHADPHLDQLAKLWTSHDRSRLCAARTQRVPKRQRTVWEQVQDAVSSAVTFTPRTTPCSLTT